LRPTSAATAICQKASTRCTMVPRRRHGKGSLATLEVWYLVATGRGEQSRTSLPGHPGMTV
jgi:hypothetical protein